MAVTNIATQNQYCVPVKMNTGTFAIDVYGTFVATLTVQSSCNNATWNTYGTITTATMLTVSEPSMHWWRVGCASPNYTSGTAKVVLSQFEQR